MEQNNKDEKKPAIPIPTLKDSKSAPQLKIKGLAQGGLSLMERLKAFKKKDLAFILAGLGVLFLAPLAEHFMMAPEGDNGGFKEGFGSRGDGGAFGKGGSPYDGGVNGLAPGGAIGNGSDVITPLNVRDPAALVMGPGATQQPPAASVPPPAAAPSKPEGDWKDALKESASRAATAAAPKAALPVPKVPLSAGGLRGLGAVSGGGGGSFSLPALNASNVPNKGNVNNSPNAIGGSGYRGPARGAGQGGDPKSLEALKAGAGAQGNLLNGPGSASQNLEAAARSQFGDGQGGGMGEGNGAGDKASGQSGSKDSKNADGQSLAFLKAKQEQEKAIEFEWKKKEAGDLDLLWFKLRDKMAEELIMTPLKAITGDIAKKISKLGTNAGDTINCTSAGLAPNDPQYASRLQNSMVQVGVDDIQSCSTAPSKDASEAGGDTYFAYGKDYSHIWTDRASCGDNSKGLNCNGGPDKNKPGPPGDNGAVSGLNGGVFGSSDYRQLCSAITTFTQPAQGRTADPNIAGAANALKAVATPLAKADAALTTGQGSGLPCDATAVSAGANKGQAIRSVLGVGEDGTPDTANTTSTWGMLNDIQTKFSAVTTRDKSAADLANGGKAPDNNNQGAIDAIAKQLETMRQKVSAPPVPPATTGATLTAADVAALKAIKDAIDAGFPATPPVDSNFTAAKTALTATGAGALTPSLTDIRTALSETQAALTQADTALVSANAPLATLRTSNADMGKTMDQYNTGLTKTRDALKAKLTIGIAEYNRQAGPGGVKALETGLVQPITSLDTDVKAHLRTPAAAGSAPTSGVKNLPDLVTSVTDGTDGSANATGFTARTGLQVANPVPTALNPFAQDATTAGSVVGAAGAGGTPAPNAAPNMTTLSTKIAGKSTDPGTTLAP